MLSQEFSFLWILKSSKRIKVVCFDHRLFTPASIPKGVDFCVHGRLCSDFGEVHAGYVSVAGNDIIAWTSVSGSFKSKYRDGTEKKSEY